MRVVLSRAIGPLKLPCHVVVERFLRSLHIVPGVIDDVLSAVKTNDARNGTTKVMSTLMTIRKVRVPQRVQWL